MLSIRKLKDIPVKDQSDGAKLIKKRKGLT